MLRGIMGIFFAYFVFVAVLPAAYTHWECENCAEADSHFENDCELSFEDTSKRCETHWGAMLSECTQFGAASEQCKGATKRISYCQSVLGATFAWRSQGPNKMQAVKQDQTAFGIAGPSIAWSTSVLAKAKKASAKGNEQVRLPTPMQTRQLLMATRKGKTRKGKTMDTKKSGKETKEKAQKKKKETKEKATPWEGAFSKTSGAAQPEAGEVLTYPKNKPWLTEAVDGCLSQISIKGRKWAGSCTSCKETHAFVMVRYPNRAGLCMKYKGNRGQIRCGLLDASEQTVEIRHNIEYRQGGASYKQGASNAGCTKVAEDRSFFKWEWMDEQARKWFESIWEKNGYPVKSNQKRNERRYMAAAKCNIRKETVCRDGVCAVRKQVGCVGVCAVKTYAGLILHKQGVNDMCSKDFCASNRTLGQYGDLVCVRAAMMA